MCIHPSPSKIQVFLTHRRKNGKVRELKSSERTGVDQHRHDATHNRSYGHKSQASNRIATHEAIPSSIGDIMQTTLACFLCGVCEVNNGGVLHSLPKDCDYAGMVSFCAVASLLDQNKSFVLLIIYSQPQDMFPFQNEILKLPMLF